MMASRTLQAMMEEQLGDFPRLLATRLMREKLKPFGCANNERLVGKFVDHLSAVSANGTDLRL